MNKKHLSKFVAIATAMSLSLSAAPVSLAADATGAIGTGGSTGHLDTDVVEAVLPVDNDVAGIFDYTIDPEDILSGADFFMNGTDAAGAGTTNTDLVYFPQASGAAKKYDSTSQAVTIKAKNYVAADVTATVTVDAASAGKTLIPLVDKAEDLTGDAAKMLLTLKVGTKTKAISATGETVLSDVLAAQNDHFNVKLKSDKSGYEVVADSNYTNWAGLDVQLKGQLNGATVTDTLEAPKVNITWTVAKHEDAPATPAATPASMSTSAKQATISNLPQGATLSSVKVVKIDNSEITLTATTQYTYSNNVFAIVTGKEVLLDNTKYKKYILTYSDGTVINIPIVAAS